MTISKVRLRPLIFFHTKSIKGVALYNRFLCSFVEECKSNAPLPLSKTSQNFLDL